MTRSEILSEALLAPPHPRYGILSYGRFERIKKLSAMADPEDSMFHTGIAWFICTRPHDDPKLLEILASADPLTPIREEWHHNMRAVESILFIEWFNGEMMATEAASTKPREESVPGKPVESSREAILTT